MIVQKYVCPLKKICLVQKKVWVRLLESCVKLWRGGRRSELHPHWSHLKITVTTAAHVRSKQCSACACACGNSGLVKRHILLHINIDQKLEWKKQLAPKNPKNSITSFSFRNKHSNITMNNVEKKVGWLEEKWERNSSPFLDAFSHLYKRVCPSVRQSVGPSVGPSVSHTRVEVAEWRCFWIRFCINMIKTYELSLMSTQHTGLGLAETV